MSGAYSGPTGVYFVGGPLDGEEYWQPGVASHLPVSCQVDDHPTYYLNRTEEGRFVFALTPPNEDVQQ